MRGTTKAAVVGATMLALLPTIALAAPSTSVTVGGKVNNPRSFTAADLSALPQITTTQTYTFGGTPVTDAFTGPTLLSVLTASGGVAADPSVKNSILRSYVVATGADGYWAAYSLGEISGAFGNRPDQVAIADSLGRLPGVDGVARTAAAGDRAGGRYVSNLVSLDVGTAAALGGTGGGATTSFNIAGAVNAPMSFDLAALQTFTPYTRTVTYASAGTSVTDTYTGALLWDVLSRAGISINPANKNDILSKIISVAGSDGYQVEFSAGELSPSFGNEGVLVAYSDTNGQVGGGAGFARLVVPGDTAGGRYVSNLASLFVFDPTATSAVPETSTWTSMMVGLGVVGGGLRRRRKAGLLARIA